MNDPMLFGREIAELNATNNAPVRTYIWGLDLSGTMGGASGVGGLLWVNQHVGSSVGAHFCAHDGNGNIVALSAASDGSETAHYEYGLPQLREEPIRVTGPMAKEIPFRFSTKCTCNTTDLVLYEYRLYNPSTSRWLRRDPIGETGGLNLLEFVRNKAISRVDWLVLLEHNTPSRNLEVPYSVQPCGNARAAVAARYGEVRTLDFIQIIVIGPGPDWGGDSGEISPIPAGEA